MERGLLLGALVLSIVSLICGLLAAKSRFGSPAGLRILPITLWVAAIGFPAIFWLLTLPDAPPFGMGHATGNGVLFGGFAATLGALALLLSVRWDVAESRAAGTAMLLSLASATAVVTLLFFKQNRLDALMGVAMGWTAASCLLYCSAVRLPVAPLLAKGTGFIVAACASIAIGAVRDSMMPGSRGGTWSTLMAVLCAVVPFVLLLSALPANMAAKRVPFPNLFGHDEDQSAAATRGWQLVLASVLFLLVAQLLAIKVADKPALLFCAALGVFAGAISWRVIADSLRQNVMPVLAPLVLLGAFIVSFRLMQGFGGGVMLLGAWLAGALAETPTSPPPTGEEFPALRERLGEGYSHSSSLTTLLFFGAAAMLYRLAATRYRVEIDALELDEHYAFFGLLVGAALPAFLARIMAPLRAISSPNLLLRLVLCGAILIAVPLFSIMLWGAKAVLVLTAGAGLGLLLAPMDIALPHAAGFFALAGTLAVAEWTKRALPLYEIARGDKAKLLGIVTLSLMILMLIVDFAARRRSAVVKPDASS